MIVQIRNVEAWNNGEDQGHSNECKVERWPSGKGKTRGHGLEREETLLVVASDIWPNGSVFSVPIVHAFLQESCLLALWTQSVIDALL